LMILDLILLAMYCITSSVERALDKLRNSNNIRCNFKTSGDEYMVDSLVSLTLLRVIQEACSNSIKHGHAKEINVSLKYEPKSLTLTIKDDGDEFTRDDNSGFGLSMMKERIYLLSGKISISSRPGEGCIVKVIIPVNKED
jgi:two-component system sensor histidine kinase DegS